MTPQERLSAAVIATEFSIARIRAAFSQFNDPAWPDELAGPLALADEFLAIHRMQTNDSVAEDYENLLGTLDQIGWPTAAFDPEQDERLIDLQDRAGRLWRDALAVVAIADEMGIRAQKPRKLQQDAVHVPKMGLARQLADLGKHVDDLEFQVEQLADSETNAQSPPQQQALVDRYRSYMARNILTIRVVINTGTVIALDALDRASTALVSATRELVATVRARASGATAALRTATAGVGRSVKSVIRSVGVLVKRVIRQNEVTFSLSIPDDYIEQAEVMILAGEAPPAHWVPHLIALDFDDTDLADLRSLSGLTALQRLVADRTLVSNLTPLASLTALQSLDLNGTQVSNLTPLASLTTLQSLDLNFTQVSNLTPLASFTALNDLRLDETEVSDLTPLARLTALEILWLSGTRVSELTPLAGLSELRSLWLDDTEVSDLTPLAGLTNLNDLWLHGTQVNDLTPLVGLTTLQNLNLNDTQVRDIAPLASLTALERLHLFHTPVNDIAPLSGLPALTIYAEDDARVAALNATLRPGSAVKVEVPDWLRPDRQAERGDDPQA